MTKKILSLKSFQENWRLIITLMIDDIIIIHLLPHTFINQLYIIIIIIEKPFDIPALLK